MTAQLLLVKNWQSINGDPFPLKADIPYSIVLNLTFTGRTFPQFTVRLLVRIKDWKSSCTRVEIYSSFLCPFFFGHLSCLSHGQRDQFCLDPDKLEASLEITLRISSTPLGLFFLTLRHKIPKEPIGIYISTIEKYRWVGRRNRGLGPGNFYSAEQIFDQRRMELEDEFSTFPWPTQTSYFKSKYVWPSMIQ